MRQNYLSHTVFFWPKTFGLIVIVFFSLHSIVFAKNETLDITINAVSFEIKTKTLHESGHWDKLVDSYITLSRKHPELEVTVTALDNAHTPAQKVVDRLKWLGGKKRQQELMQLEEENINSFNSEFSGSCQEWTKVNSYKIDLNGQEIYIPKNLEVIFNDNLIFKSEELTDWVSPYNSIHLATINNILLILIVDEDCEDYLDRKLLIVSDNGEILAREDIWSGHWKDQFFFRNNNITYWSEWFCQENNKEASIDNAYVYTWPGYGKFEKEFIPREEICSDNAIAKMGQNKIQFERHAPIAH